MSSAFQSLMGASCMPYSTGDAACLSAMAYGMSNQTVRLRQTDGLDGMNWQKFQQEVGINSNKTADKAEEKNMGTTGWSFVPQSVENYIERHKDMIYTIAIVLLADHFFFKGKFRVKAEQMVESLIDRASGKVASGAA